MIALLAVGLNISFTRHSQATEVLPVADVSASDHDGNGPENVLDGDLATRWSAQGDGQWLLLNLGRLVTVEAVSMAFYKGGVRQAFFDIQTSADGANWRPVLSDAASSGTTLDSQTFRVHAGMAHYVRIVGYGNSRNGWNSYTEVAILGSSIGAVSTTTWQSFRFVAQAGYFTATFESVPHQERMNAVTGLSPGAAQRPQDLAVIVRFNKQGHIDARNGNRYMADRPLAYTAGRRYHVRLEIDIVARTYSVYVRPEGEAEQTLGVDYAFRTQQAQAVRLTTWAVKAWQGSHTVTNFALGLSSTAPWRHGAFLAQDGTFTATFESVPHQERMNAVTGLSPGAAQRPQDLAVIVRFNKQGHIDARNGDRYMADRPLAYTAGRRYHVRLEIDIVARTYSVYVRPEGEAEQTLGVDYAFRTQQAQAVRLTTWAVKAWQGSHTVTQFALSPEVNALVHRIGDLLHSNTGIAGLYLKQVHGPVLASLHSTEPFYPASTIKVLQHLHAIHEVEAGHAALTDRLPVYTNIASSERCADIHTAPPDTSETLEFVLRRMMVQSDNERSNAVQDFFGAGDASRGREAINHTAHNVVGLSPASVLHHKFGCRGPTSDPPNRLTLVDCGALYEQVATNVNVLTPPSRALFYQLMLNETNSGLLNGLIEQEARTLDLSAADVQAFKALVELAYKAGAAGSRGRRFDSIAGWVQLPFKSGSTIVHHQYVFGLFVHESDQTQRHDRELLRDVVRAALRTW